MSDVTAWLMDPDAAIRWQVFLDLTGVPAVEVAAERARVAGTGWGRRLLDLQVDGQSAGGACFPGADWSRAPTVRAAVDGVREHSTWEYAGEPFFEGEVEPCINGGAVAVGAYFGAKVDGIVARLLGGQLEDGGWNCEAENGSIRSSFHSTICVLDGLLEYECAGGTIPVAGARRRGEEYLLTRSLFRRASTGEVADPDWLQFSFPTQWRYDVLRGLDYLRSVGGAPDPRLSEPDGSWLLENTHPGLVHFDLEGGDGEPSRWNTLRALRVLRWYDAPRRA